MKKLNDEILLAAAKEFGTPLFVYDANCMLECYHDLYKFIDYPKLQVHYAMKANYNFHLLKYLENAGASIDAVSPGDVLLAQKAGFSSDRILYTANNLMDYEVEQVVKSGVLINIGSLSRLQKFATKYPNSKVCIRFNPDVVDGDHENTKTAGDATKFGILMQDVEKVKEICGKGNLKVVGLHEHTGSGLQHTESVFQSMKNLMTLATKENFPDLEFLDFGGGFKVTYNPEEKAVDYQTMGKEIVRLFTNYCKEYGKDLKMYFEPGKFIVAQCGYLLTTANTIKNNNGRIIIGCNSGFPQLIRPAMYQAYHHIINLSNPNGTLTKVDVCGNICETGDRFAENRKISEIREGDILSIENAGAYCYAMGGVYNLRPMPTEVVVKDGKISLARKGLTTEELVNRIVEMSE